MLFKAVTLIVCIFIFLISCNGEKNYEYEPLPNLFANYTSGEFQSTTDGYVASDIIFEFNNMSEAYIVFDVSEVELVVNEKRPVQVFYNSIGSNLWPIIDIKQGISEHKIHVILEDQQDKKTDASLLEIIDNGLRIK